MVGRADCCCLPRSLEKIGEIVLHLEGKKLNKDLLTVSSNPVLMTREPIT